MATSFPATMPTWPATWSAPPNCPLTYVESPTNVADASAPLSTGLWQDFFVGPLVDAKTLSCHPPPGPTNWRFAYRATVPSGCPLGWTNVADSSSPTSTGTGVVSWECCSSGWTYTTISESSIATAVCQSFVPTVTKVLAYETNVLVDDIGDEDSPIMTTYTETSTFSTKISSMTATAMPITVVYYPSASTPPNPSSTPLSSSQLAGIGLSAGVLGAVFFVCLIVFIVVVRRRKRKRRFRKYNDIPTTAAIVGSTSAIVGGKYHTVTTVERIEPPQQPLFGRGLDFGRQDTVKSTAATVGYGSRYDAQPVVEVPTISSFYSPWGVTGEGDLGRQDTVKSTAATVGFGRRDEEEPPEPFPNLEARLPVMPIPPPPPILSPISPPISPPAAHSPTSSRDPDDISPVSHSSSAGAAGRTGSQEVHALPPVPSLRSWPRGDARYVRRI